ncbi:MAG: carbon monoxide dehydrogenase subunit G [Candidatus Nitrosomirales archaeon]|jgi:carbon monoxide dehydrogenase subunit G
MVRIEASREINAPLEKVWEIASDMDNEPKYWHGTKSVKNLKVDGNTINREVIIAFKNSKCMETVVLNPKKSIDIQITEGPMKGSKAITLNDTGGKTKVDVVWDIKLTGMMSMFTGMVKGHIEQGTKDALERISADAEK